MRGLWRVVRRLLRWAVVATTLLALAGGGWYWWTAARGAQTATVYATGVTYVTDLVVAVTGAGPLQPLASQELKAEVAGTVRAVHVAAGDPVTAGQPLVQLENETLELQYRQALLELEAARLELAEILGVEPDQVTSLPADAALLVRAPLAGRVTEVRVKPGESVGSGATIARLADDRALVASTRVPPALLAHAQPGNQVTLRVEGFAVVQRNQLAVGPRSVE